MGHAGHDQGRGVYQSGFAEERRRVLVEREIGSIAVGKLAELAILDADPLADIRNSSKVSMVMKSGRLYRTATLDELWPGRAGYGRIPWPTGPSRR